MNARRIAAAVAGATLTLTIAACSSSGLASPQAGGPAAEGAPAKTSTPSATHAPTETTTTQPPQTSDTTTQPPQTSEPQAASLPTSSQAPKQQDCDVNINAPEVKAAIAKVKPYEGAGANYQWSKTAWDGDYDRCAPLTTALISIDGATGSSPNQALLFHNGHYIGTATSQGRPFMTFNKGASSEDTVAIDYSDRPCTACNATSVDTVKFHWNGSKVQMIGTPPPA